MSAGVSIARVTDARECAEIRPLAVAHAQFERSDAVVPPDWGERVAGLIGRGRLTLFVARLRDIPLGYATVTEDVETWTTTPFAHLDCLFVDEQHRSAGIGRMLVAEAAAHARSRGITQVQWQTPSWNERAIRFYEGLGATHRSKQRFSYPVGPAPTGSSPIRPSSIRSSV